MPAVGPRHGPSLSLTGGCRYKSGSSALQFYQNRQMELYAAKPTQRLTLRQLVFYGRSMSEERLLKSANYVRTELPVRIAHRLKDLQALPYIVVMQEGVSKVYELYWIAFEKFRRYPQIDTLEDNEAFCVFLRSIVNDHAVVIPSLSLGLSLSSPYLQPDQLDSFVRRMLISRISRRVLAEHHLALSDSYMGRDKRSNSDGDGHVGIIYTGLNVKKSVDKCAMLLRENFRQFEGMTQTELDHMVWPEIIVDGHVETQFSYIREHLEYIIFELLKNSVQATVRLHGKVQEMPSIRVTIVAGEDDIGVRISDQGGGLMSPDIKSPSDLFSFSHLRNPSRMDDQRLGTLRSVSEDPKGVKATVEEQIARWEQERRVLSTTVQDQESEASVGPYPRLGIGLPMCNIYATYFGGSIELVSLDGWGTDVYLRLPKLGTNLEGIEV
ncbi:alpha-ketoacid dehydrogenase kinase [Dentipellis sp. KUC8613]|nr:alpha-ketoacid dehydrogenase kinase [Dentipellis sp. KUC8613]